jgi:hypothetical protein
VLHIAMLNTLIAGGGLTGTNLMFDAVSQSTPRDPKHDYWLGKGLNALARFEEAMVAMSGVRP